MVASYEAVQHMTPKLKETVCASSNGLVPAGDKFIHNFLKLYSSKDGSDLRKSLIFCLMQNYVTKSLGHKNPEYGGKVLNFMMAVAATNATAFSLVSANLCSVSIRHMGRLKAKKRASPFLMRDNAEIASTLASKISMIRKTFGDESKRVAFSVGIDATVNVKGYQVLHQEQVVVGGAFPNHSIDISHMSKDDLVKFLAQCVGGKKGSYLRK